MLPERVIRPDKHAAGDGDAEGAAGREAEGTQDDRRTECASLRRARSTASDDAALALGSQQLSLAIRVQQLQCN